MLNIEERLYLLGLYGRSKERRTNKTQRANRTRYNPMVGMDKDKKDIVMVMVTAKERVLMRRLPKPLR